MHSHWNLYTATGGLGYENIRVTVVGPGSWTTYTHNYKETRMRVVGTLKCDVRSSADGRTEKGFYTIVQLETRDNWAGLYSSYCSRLLVGNFIDEAADDAGISASPVSYTHLTLPTKRIV